jgi:hypothetical protein
MPKRISAASMVIYSRGCPFLSSKGGRAQLTFVELKSCENSFYFNPVWCLYLTMQNVAVRAKMGKEKKFMLYVVIDVTDDKLVGVQNKIHCLS